MKTLNDLLDELSKERDEAEVNENSPNFADYYEGQFDGLDTAIDLVKKLQKNQNAYAKSQAKRSHDEYHAIMGDAA